MSKIDFSTQYSQDKDTRFYLRGNIIDKFWSLGAAYKAFGADQALDLAYSTNDEDKAKGLGGSPFFLRWGAAFKLAGGHVLKSHLLAHNDVLVTHKWEAPVNKTTKVIVTDQMNLLKAFTDPKAMGYKVGMNVEFSM